MQTILTNLFGALAAKLLRMLGWNDAEVGVLAAKARTDLKNSDLHMYLSYFFCQ